MNIWDTFGKFALGPVGSLAGSIVGNLFANQAQEKTNQANIQMTRETNDMNRMIAQETNQANREMAEFAYRQNLEQWHRENEYNSPAAQMSRLKEAGLNPNLVYGSIGNTAGGSPTYDAPTMQGSTYQAPHVQKYNRFGDFGASDAANAFLQSQMTSGQVQNMKEQNSLLKTQGRALAQEILMTHQKMIGQMIENEKEGILRDRLRETYANSLKESDLNIEKLMKELNLQDANLENVQSQTQYNNVRAGLVGLQQHLTSAQIREVSARADNLLKEGQILDKQLIDYTEYGIRPNDPAWARALVTAIDDVMKPSKSEKSFFGKVIDGILNMFK